MRQQKHGGTACFDDTTVKVVLTVHRDEVRSFTVRTPEVLKRRGRYNQRKN